MKAKFYNNKLTLIVVSYHSGHIIENLINSFEKNIKILIIENSLDYNLKLKLEKNYKNVEVIIPQKNLGNGGGINLGLKLSKTDFSLYLDADITPDNEMINILLEHTNKIKNFAILAPKEKDYIYSESQYIHHDTKNNFHKMKFITGCALLFNMKTLPKTGNFDENIFLYYEEHDFFYRCLQNKLDIYLIDKAKFFHQGTSSTNNIYNNEIYLNRNWHYCWSKFYYFKKNYGYFYGIKKTLPNFLRAIRKYFFFKFKGDKKNSSLHKAELQGLITSYLLKKSTKRPNINL
jgi:GT2 family glycosyltransferase